MQGLRVRAFLGAAVLLFAVTAKAIPAGAAGQSVDQKLKVCAEGAPLGSFMAYLHTVGLQDFAHVNIEVGTPGDDTFTDTPGVDLMCGLAGNDYVETLHAGDVFFGGPGNDSVGAPDHSGSGMFGGTFDGGAGDDFVANADGGTFNGGPGDDLIWSNL
jgi:Ca2+-binding RTX toxin-like protein